MRPSEILRLVLLNINQNKFKSIMTSIGIVVGAATIVMVIGIGTGGKMDIREQFSELNAGEINVSYEYAGEEETSGGSAGGIGGFFGNMFSGIFGGGNPFGGSSDTGNNSGGAPSGFSGGGPDGFPSGGNFPGGGDFDSADFPGGDFPGAPGEETEESTESTETDSATNLVEGRLNQEKIVLTSDDVDDIKTYVSGISGATISYSTKSSIEGGNLTSEQTYTVAGVTEEMQEVSKLTLSAGAFVSEIDDETQAKVCVLGSDVAVGLFGKDADPVDSTIYIDDRGYTVIGVLKSTTTVSAGISPDTTIFIPYQTGVKYITGETIDPNITVIAEDVTTLSDVIAGVKFVLTKNYTNATFTFEDSGSKMEAALASNNTLTMLLAAMAAIVFLVGGIGIMNVLFVSVKERTNEIGILKAIGTPRSNILVEFLIESAVISLMGGVIGVALSFIVTPIVQYFGVRVEVNAIACLIAIGFAVLTGTIFGIYPAWKASRLEPVDALNAE